MFVLADTHTRRERKKLDLLLPVGKVNKWQQNEKFFETCPKGFGLKLAKLGLKIPLKNKVKQKQSKAEPS